MIAYIRLIRLKNWLKNIFVFVPITFALELTDWNKLSKTIICFLAFCFISSAVYVFNDIFDADRDASHPVKYKRPIASGVIMKRSATVLFIVLILTGFGLAYISNISVCVIICFYLFVNILYTVWLKQKPIFDCFCIASGFVLRIFAGGGAFGGGVSDWLFLTIAAMALFMAFGKRRGELIKMGTILSRAVLKHYNKLFLNGLMFTSAGLSITFYSLWAMNQGSNMIFTVPLIIFIVCKYLLLVCDSNNHGDPTTVILSSKTLLAACGVYSILVVALLYMGTVL